MEKQSMLNAKAKTNNLSARVLAGVLAVLIALGLFTAVTSTASASVDYRYANQRANEGSARGTQWQNNYNGVYSTWENPSDSFTLSSQYANALVATTATYYTTFGATTPCSSTNTRRNCR